jgi:hypothetical protein
MVKAVPRISTLNRSHCRHVFETRFTVGRMVQDYLSAYEALVTSQDEQNEMPAVPVKAVNF